VSVPNETTVTNLKGIGKLTTLLYSTLLYSIEAQRRAMSTSPNQASACRARCNLPFDPPPQLQDESVLHMAGPNVAAAAVRLGQVDVAAECGAEFEGERAEWREMAVVVVRIRVY
jgi:hypothetical protein